jgi:hypothetical protein
MADRYWVGGTGTWDGASTANWSATSGGSAGASAPTSADNVFFDQTGPYSVTMNGTRACANWTVSVGVVTFVTGTITTMTVNGNVSWTAGTIAFSGAGYVFAFSGAGTKTITTNNVTPPGNPVQFNTGTFNLGSAFSAGNITLGSNAILTTNNNALTASAFFGTGTMNWGSSTVTASGGTVFATGSNITLNAGTSQLNCTAATVTLNATGTPALTYNNVAFTLVGSAATITINNANTFNTLSFVGRTNTGVNRATFTANQTISTLTLNAGTTAAFRTMLQSDTIGTPRTLAVTTLTAGAADYDFRDIAVTGSAAPLSVTRAGDCKGNSGITFPAAKTVYYRATGSGNWGVASPGSWSLTSGGAFDDTAFPLAQDTAVFPAATYPASGSTTTIPSNYNIGTIDMSLRTSNTMTLSTTTGTLTIYGNWVNGTGITLSGTTVVTFTGQGSQTITSAGRTFTQAFTIDTPGGSVTLQDNFVASRSLAGVLTLTQGTFNAATFNVTLSGAAAGVAASGTGTRTIAIGSGTWSIAGTTGAWDASTSTNLTVTGTGTISLTSASTKTFAGGGIQTYPTLNQGGTGTLTVAGSNRFAAITATTAGTVALTSGTTTQVPFINTTGTATVTVNPTSTTATIRSSVRSSRAALTGPLVLGAA